MREIEPILPNVDCTDEGRTKSKVLDIYLPEGSGTFRLELQLNVGKSAHLNRDAPSTWKMTLPLGWQKYVGTPDTRGASPCTSGNRLQANLILCCPVP